MSKKHEIQSNNKTAEANVGSNYVKNYLEHQQKHMTFLNKTLFITIL